MRNVAAAIRRRKQYGTNFSIVAVAEGAMPVREAAHFIAGGAPQEGSEKTEKARAKKELIHLRELHAGHTMAGQATGGTDASGGAGTILGYVQRGARHRRRTGCWPRGSARLRWS